MVPCKLVIRNIKSIGSAVYYVRGIIFLKPVMQLILKCYVIVILIKAILICL